MPATLLGRLMLHRLIVFFIIFTVFTGCYKEHLYVQQEWVDRSFLASSKIGTPDPRQECPPEGQRILVAWRFPDYLFFQQLRLRLTVRFWDNTEEVIDHFIHRTRSYAAFNFYKKKILTYRIEVVNGQDEVIETWEHQFWTELINIDRKSLSVSSHPRHGSVMETP